MNYLSPHSRKARQGVALVITLAFVVLLTGLIVAFFSRSMSDRKLSDNSFSQASADQLASSAISILTGDLKQEIVNGSTALPNPNPNSFPLVYVAGTNSAYMVPARNGVSGTWNTGAPVKTLIRVSSTNTIASPGVDQQASNAPSTGISANGKSISAARWNRHYLLPLKTPTAPTDTTPDIKFTAPSWVYVTGGGPANPALTAPSSSVTGRYAYAIYDEGALLDVNVAGYPYVSGTTPAQFIYKGALTFTDLTQIPGLTQTGANNLVAWRNYASLQSTGTFPTLAPSSAVVGGTNGLNYVNWIMSGTTGFLTASGTAYNGATDQVFMSRRQLIDLAIASGTAYFNPTALQYLGTFSRAITAPSWIPSADSNNFPSYVGGLGTAIAPYRTNAENPASENRDIPNVRFSGTATVTHYADDGTTTSYKVVAGDPLLQHRFSLKRLDWFTPTGPATGKATAILDCFGLTWDGTNSRWTYNHGDPINIKTLNAVSLLNREPDFFELLKAAILDGSLGRDPGNQTNAGAEVTGQGGLTVNGPAGRFFNIYSATSDAQIIQIGANIIDQYDADSLPTAIYFANISNPDTHSTNLTDLFNTFHGIENIPYPMAIRTLLWRNLGNVNYAWLQPAMWNPHQSLPWGYTGTVPSGYRLHAYGQGAAKSFNGNTGKCTYDPSTPTWPGVQFITFNDTSSPFQAKPVFLTTAQAGSTDSGTDTLNVWPTAATGTNTWPSPSGTVAGQFVAFITGTCAQTPTGTGSYVGAADPNEITFVAEYQTGTNSNWLPYARIARYDAYLEAPTSYQNPLVIQGVDASRPDPRTDRFSLSFANGIAQNSTTHWPVAGTVYTATWFPPSTNSGFVFQPTASNGGGGVVNKPGYYSTNLQTGTTSYYADPDGVIRPADGYRGNNTTGDGRPTFTGNGAPATPAGSGTAAGDTTSMQHGRRPIVLNRPFRSVGELGYVFRDEPFKSLDFWSKDSADGGLLDVFAIRDEPAVMVAGQLNPNNAPALVLQAIFAGASKKEIDPAFIITGTMDAATLSGTIAADISANGPYSNRADLATRLGPLVSGTASTVAFKTTTASNWANKAYAEAPMRALADVTNTRTWNLMIDVFAQTGVFASNAPATTQALTSSFVVHGERRYWLHIAIDRFTGKVVDQMLEPVYE